ncbi:hypothetical protein [Oceanobacillus salinisoli]|uniref:hypothetical protein n=1 Tax=Oceanobacillus salinisoli TaxID=2678611 RepID=UPI0012E109D3|nr:hypothetical protein [Oceanobacillus salinisoli]
MNPLPFPVDFNINEWFVILSLGISYIGIFLLPNRLPASILILIILFSATIARIFDHSLAGPNLNLYNLMDSGKYELFDFLSYLLYGPFAYVFLYIYQKYSIKGLYLLLYIAASSVLAVTYEWITVLFNVFTFEKWRSIYSYPVYLFVQSLTIVFYHLLQKHLPVKS